MATKKGTASPVLAMGEQIITPRKLKDSAMIQRAWEEE
jgi:hypothetical protein